VVHGFSHDVELAEWWINASTTDSMGERIVDFAGSLRPEALPGALLGALLKWREGFVVHR